MADALAGPTEPRLPNLVIIGVSKAGTTSLFNYLGQHPDIGTSDVKELRYFTPLRYGKALEPIETYAAHFSACAHDKIAVEATPGYFYGGRPLARGLHETLPAVRCVVSLRSPEERCWSWFGFVKSRLRIPKEMTFEAYLDRCEDLHRAGVDGHIENQPFWGLGGGCYAQWLDEWIDEFGERFRVVFFDDLAKDPRTVVTSICDWIGLDTAPIETFAFAVDNRTQQYRNKGLQKVAVSLNRRTERFFHRHPTAKRVLRRGYYAVNRPRTEPSMPPEQRARLADFYRPHNLRLAEQLATVGLSLPPSWSGSGQTSGNGSANSRSSLPDSRG